MSALEKPARTWHEIASELLAAQDPQEIIQLAVDLVSAFDRDKANRNRLKESQSGGSNA